MIEVRNATKVYKRGKTEVRALNLEALTVPTGQFLSVMGASGSGKSTLLNLIGGLDTPTAGAIHYADHDLARADDEALTRYRREHVGFVFQFYNLIPSLTARENVELAAELVPRPMAAAEALRYWAIATLGRRWNTRILVIPGLPPSLAGRIAVCATRIMSRW